MFFWEKKPCFWQWFKIDNCRGAIFWNGFWLQGLLYHEPKKPAEAFFRLSIKTWIEQKPWESWIFKTKPSISKQPYACNSKSHKFKSLSKKRTHYFSKDLFHQQFSGDYYLNGELDLQGYVPGTERLGCGVSWSDVSPFRSAHLTSFSENNIQGGPWIQL